MSVQTGVIESAAAIPLEEALARWRREAFTGVLDVGHYRCRFYVWGRGLPLLFVHGLTDQARSFVPVMAHLTESFRCIAYELPTGHGDGARLGAIRHADLVADVFKLLDHLHVVQASLYGASFGATIVLRALHTHPRRFLRAATHGTFAYRRVAPAERFVLNFARYWPGTLGDLAPWRWLQRRADSPLFEGVSPELWQFQRANTAATPIRAFAHRALLVSRLDLRPILPSIRHPVLLIRGDQDPVVSPAEAQQLANALPHADQLEFDQCGHHPQYTHAAPLAESLCRFLLPPCGLT